MKTKILTRATILESRKYRVDRCQASNSRGLYPIDIIVHPGAAVILPILDDGRIVMIRQERPSVDLEMLELPAGTLDPGEAPLICAGRELTEETGYVAAEVQPLLSFYSSPGFCNEILHAFIATGLQAGEAQREANEQIDNVTLSLDEALSAIRDGQIKDGKSIVTLLYYRQFNRIAESG